MPYKVPQDNDNRTIKTAFFNMSLKFKQKCSCRFPSLLLFFSLFASFSQLCKCHCRFLYICVLCKSEQCHFIHMHNGCFSLAIADIFSKVWQCSSIAYSTTSIRIFLFITSFTHIIHLFFFQSNVKLFFSNFKGK